MTAAPMPRKPKATLRSRRVLASSTKPPGASVVAGATPPCSEPVNACSLSRTPELSKIAPVVTPPASTAATSSGENSRLPASSSHQSRATPRFFLLSHSPLRTVTSWGVLWQTLIADFDVPALNKLLQSFLSSGKASSHSSCTPNQLC